MSIQLLAICTGTVSPLFIRDDHDDRRIGSEMSGIQKSPVSTIDAPKEVMCKRLGIDGDEQADLSVHGGLNKAVYCYPLEHYAFWKNALPWLAERDSLYGQVGENLCMQGLLEHELWIGDRIRIGEEVVLMVTKPREPCFKFNARMKSNQAAKLMKQHSVSGWYCSVLSEGRIKPGDAINIIAGARDTSVLKENQRLSKPRA